MECILGYSVSLVCELPELLIQIIETGCTLVKLNESLESVGTSGFI